MCEISDRDLRKYTLSFSMMVDVLSTDLICPYNRDFLLLLFDLIRSVYSVEAGCFMVEENMT